MTRMYRIVVEDHTQGCACGFIVKTFSKRQSDMMMKIHKKKCGKYEKPLKLDNTHTTLDNRGKIVDDKKTIKKTTKKKRKKKQKRK